MTRGESPEWRGSAFGLSLSGAFVAPGLAGETRSSSSAFATELALVARGDLGEGWAPVEVELLYEQVLPNGRFAIRRHPERGYRLEHTYYGQFWVATDGARISCAPEDLPNWLWQRFLVGQVLPLASLLQEYEVLHGSAAAIDGSAVLVMGASGAGKSSVCLHLVAGGATFLTDDVAALELRDGAVLTHPGPGLASLDEDELARLPPEQTGAWERLGVSDGEVRLMVTGAGHQALPVAAIYLLTHRPEARRLEIVATAAAWPEALLGGTFNAYLRDAGRLVRQLEVAGRLAETVPLREVTVPEGVGAGAVADAIASSFRP